MAEFLIDGLIHAPISDADYNARALPGLAQTFVDPVFGGIVKQLTNIGASTAMGEFIYGFSYANADGTYIFHYLLSGAGGVMIVRVSDGAVVHSSQPDGIHRQEIRWHPSNPDKYLYFEGADLRWWSLAAQNFEVIHTFPSALQEMGASVNYCDRDATKFVVQYGGAIHIYDSVENAIYSGTIAMYGGNGYCGISPDGNYAWSTTPTSGDHTFYPLNHAANSIGAGVMCWSIGGGHAACVSATDGKTYLICLGDDASRGVYRIDVTISQAGRSSAQQVADALLLFSPDWQSVDFAAVMRGPKQNWVFGACMDADTGPEGGDSFNNPVSEFTYPYRSEVVSMDVLTAEVRRHAHHRSRCTSGGLFYYNGGQCRMSCAPDGSLVLWQSNFNNSFQSGGEGHGNLLAIQNPLGLVVPKYLPFRLAGAEAGLALAAGAIGSRQKIGRREFFRRASGLLAPAVIR